MGQILRFSIIFLSFHSAMGASASTSSAPFHPYHLGTRLKGEKVRFYVEPQAITSGGYQTVVSFVEERLMMPDSERVLLFGRDLNDDHFPETWFLRGERHAITELFTISPPENPSEDPSGKTAIIKLLPFIEKNLSNRPLVGMMLGGAVEFLSFAISDAETAGRNYMLQQLDLYELRERAIQMSNAENQAYFQLLFDQGWSENDQELLKHTRGWSAVLYSATDIAMVGMSRLVFRWVEKGGTWVLKKTGAKAWTKSIAAQASVRSLSGTALRTEIQYGLKALAHQKRWIKKSLSILSRRFKKLPEKGADTMLSVYREGILSWDYVLRTQLMQVLAEGYARWDEIYDPNPLVIVNNLFTDKDFLQNFLYMTNETTLLAGAVHQQKSFGKRIRLCAILAASNSTAMNFMIKDGVDPKRAVFDVTWEVTAGTAQTFLDDSMIHHFNQLALKKKNPRYKLVGYALAMVDQVVGYWSYSKSTQGLLEENEEKLAIIPVVIENSLQ